MEKLLAEVAKAAAIAAASAIASKIIKMLDDEKT